MKQSILFFLCLFAGITGNLNAQSSVLDSKGAIGVTFSGVGENSAYPLESVDGAGGYDSKGYYSLGITYIRPLTQRIDVETGISYSQYKYRFSNSSLGLGGRETYDLKNAVVDIPLTIRWKFLKYFFLNGGLLIGIDTGTENTLDSQTGVGAMIGIGAKYDLKNIPAGLFINPYFKMYSLIPFSPEKYHKRASEGGFRVGIVYYLP